jgi:hypothetical protein
MRDFLSRASLLVLAADSAWHPCLVWNLTELQIVNCHLKTTGRGPMAGRPLASGNYEYSEWWTNTNVRNCVP